MEFSLNPISKLDESYLLLRGQRRRQHGDLSVCSSQLLLQGAGGGRVLLLLLVLLGMDDQLLLQHLVFEFRDLGLKCC